MPSTDNSSLQPMVSKLELWTDLDDDDRAAVLALPHTVRKLESGHYVVWEGEKPQHSCVLLGGFAYRHKVVADGRRQILSLHMKGDLVDLQNSLLGLADHSVQMLTDGEIAMIPVEAIRQVAIKRPTVGLAMWHDTLVDGSIFREWIANVGQRDAKTRIAHLMCEFALRLKAAGLGERTRYELPMTQEQIADATGLTSVHVNRTLMSLGADGLITRSKRVVTIADWEKLARVGDFNSRYLHFQHAQLTAA